MIKHICICDKCGKEENLDIAYGPMDEKYQSPPPKYILPKRWEEHGVCPKYTLCGECSSTLKRLIEGEIYKFVNQDKKEGE